MKWHVGYIWSLLELFLEYIKRYKQYTIRDDTSQGIHGFYLVVCLLFFICSTKVSNKLPSKMRDPFL